MLRSMFPSAHFTSTKCHEFAAVHLGLRSKAESLLRLGADPDYEESYLQISDEDGNETYIPAYRFPEELRGQSDN